MELHGCSQPHIRFHYGCRIQSQCWSTFGYVQTEIDNLMAAVWEILFEDFPVTSREIQSQSHAKIENVFGVFLRAEIF